jgi:hypothetical protein
MEHHTHPIKVDALRLGIANQRQNVEGLKWELARRKRDLADFAIMFRDAECKLAELEKEAA